jgi:hypothetical protein
MIDDARAAHDTSTLTLALAAHALAMTYRGDYKLAGRAATEAVTVGTDGHSVWTPTAIAAKAILALYQGDLDTLKSSAQAYRQAAAAIAQAPEGLDAWVCWGLRSTFGTSRDKTALLP